MLYVIPDTLLKGTLNTNKNGHMMYVITDMLLKAGLFLKVVLNTNKNVHHIIHYNWHCLKCSNEVLSSLFVGRL